jgi:hypothetical protein
MQMGEFFDCKNRFERERVPGPEGWADTWTPAEWPNINGFLAVLVAQDLIGTYGYGVTVLRHTLE